MHFKRTWTNHALNIKRYITYELLEALVQWLSLSRQGLDKSCKRIISNIYPLLGRFIFAILKKPKLSLKYWDPKGFSNRCWPGAHWKSTNQRLSWTHQFVNSLKRLAIQACLGTEKILDFRIPEVIFPEILKSSIFRCRNYQPLRISGEMFRIFQYWENKTAQELARGYTAWCPSWPKILMVRTYRYLEMISPKF